MEDNKNIPESIDFKTWPLDLLCDYILKVYHRGIRENGPKIMAMIQQACKENGDEHPTLYEVKELFEMSMIDLEHHLQKEERVLFPYIYALCSAKMHGTEMPVFHCGSIANPIEVMKIEHDAETERYRHIEDLTGGFSAPEDASDAYRSAMSEMKQFDKALHQHIHLENDILFPEAIKLQDEVNVEMAAPLG